MLAVQRLGPRTFEQLADACDELGWEPPKALLDFEAVHLLPENEPAWLTFEALFTAGPMGPHPIALQDIEAWCRLTGCEFTAELVRSVRTIERLMLESHAGAAPTAPGNRGPSSRRTNGHPGPPRNRR